MKQYIDKAAVVEEILKRRERNKKNKLNIAAAFEDNYLLSFIDILEVKEIKEVDVENTAITEWNDYIKKIDGEPNYAYMLVKREDYISLAKHFYELGQISTRKED